MICLLCDSNTTLYAGDVFRCEHCHLIFKDPKCHLTEEEDVRRYSSHMNNREDPGYVNFLGRVLTPLKEFLPESFTALDFGCGPGPTLSYLLEEAGGTAKNFDPIFLSDEKVLLDTYDVVTSTEVVEHFKNVKADWSQLTSVVKCNGLLAVMTQFIDENINYESWWYKNDPTHVVFYQLKTFEYLAEKFNFEILYNDNKSVVIMRKK